MNEELREVVCQRLKAAQDCPAKEDVIEEITADLTEKYNELVNSGVEPEQAMTQVRDGIGDLEEVVSFINDACRRNEAGKKKSGGSSAFAGLDDLLRQLSKDLQPSMREMANDLKSAAGHAVSAAKDVARDAKDPLRNMANEVFGSVKNVVKNMTSSYDHGGCRYDYTVNAEGLTGVEVRTSAGDITFGFSEDENIYIVEFSKSELSEDKLAQIQVSDGVLQIAQGQKFSAGSLLFNYGMLHSDFEIYLPRRVWNSLRVYTCSGDIKLDKAMETENLSLHTTSGDLECPEVKTESAEIETVSGDLQMSGTAQELRLVTVSGDCQMSGASEKLSLQTTSGDLQLRLDIVPDQLDVQTVSGDTRLYLPDNDGFTLRYKRVSGDLRSDFELTTSLNCKSGTAVYLSGGSRVYSLQTVSGDLRIYRK